MKCPSGGSGGRKGISLKSRCRNLDESGVEIETSQMAKTHSPKFRKNASNCPDNLFLLLNDGSLQKPGRVKQEAEKAMDASWNFEPTIATGNAMRRIPVSMLAAPTNLAAVVLGTLGSEVVCMMCQYVANSGRERRLLRKYNKLCTVY